MLFFNQSLYLSTEHTTTQFMAHYRSSFPDPSITVKIHLLEDHTVPWFRLTRAGFGLLGEQRAAAIHATLQRTYHSIRDKAQQLTSRHSERALPLNCTSAIHPRPAPPPPQTNNVIMIPIHFCCRGGGRTHLYYTTFM